MKLKVSISVGVYNPRNGKTKIFNRTAKVDMQLSPTAIIKIPIDARGGNFVDVKIERPNK